MRYGRTPDPGFLSVYSVDTEEQAKKLLTLACGTNFENEFVARELIEEQTLDNLKKFGKRLAWTEAVLDSKEVKKKTASK